MSKKRWDNDVTEFLFPKGLLIRILVAIGLCLLVWLFITTIENGRERKKTAELQTVKENMQDMINRKQFSEAEGLLSSYMSDYGSSGETDEIAADLLSRAAHGCWKGYGEWNSGIHDSSGECFLYFYYPEEGDALYVSGEHEAYYLVFSETEFSSADEVIKECQTDPGSCRLLSGVECQDYNRIMHDGVLIFRCYEPDLEPSSEVQYAFSYTFKDDTAKISYKSSRVSLERME